MIRSWFLIKKHRCWPVLLLVLVTAGLLMYSASPAVAENAGTSIEDRPFPLDAGSTNDSSQVDTHTNVVLMFFKVILALILIIVLAYLIIKTFGHQANHRFRGRWLQVVDELVIGPNRGVVLCEIGGRIIALGITDHNINVLFEIEDEDLIKEIIAAGPAGEPSEWGTEALKNILTRIKPTKGDQFEEAVKSYLGSKPLNSEHGERKKGL